MWEQTKRFADTDVYRRVVGLRSKLLKNLRVSCEMSSRIRWLVIRLMVQKSSDHQLRLVVYPIIFKVLYIPGGADFLHQQYYSSLSFLLVTRSCQPNICGRNDFFAGLGTVMFSGQIVESAPDIPDTVSLMQYTWNLCLSTAPNFMNHQPSTNQLHCLQN